LDVVLTCAHPAPARRSRAAAAALVATEAAVRWCAKDSRRCRRATVRLLVRSGGRRERGAQVRGDGVELRAPSGLVEPAFHRARRVGGPAEVTGLRLVLLAGGGQLRERERADRLQQPPAARRAAHVRHEALVDQPTQLVGHPGAIPADGGGRIDVEGSDEHAEAAEQRLLLLVEQVVAPGHDRVQGPVPLLAAPPARQQPDRVVERGEQAGGAQ
jgi:hypothetical protein